MSLNNFYPKAIGISPFSIENGSDSPDSPFVKGYSKLKELMPYIMEAQGKDIMKGFLFDQEDKERSVIMNDIKVKARHYFTLPWDSRAKDGSQWSEGGGLIINTAPNEFILAGSGIVAEFEKSENNTEAEKILGEDGFIQEGNNSSLNNNEKWTGKSRIGIGYVDEVIVDENGSLKYMRRLNGDEDHQGRHARISVDDFKILKIKLYEYR